MAYTPVSTTKTNLRVTYKLEGAETLFKDLEAMGDRIAKKGLRKALREGGRPFLRQAKLNVPVRSGALKKSLKLRAGRRSRVWMSYVVTTSKESKGNLFVGKHYYAGFVEFGAPRRGLMPSGFLRRAFESRKEESKKIVADELRKFISAGAK